MREKIFLIPLIGVLLLVMAGAGPPDAPAELQQAEALMKNGQYDQAEAIYMQILTDHPPAEVAFEAQKELVIIYIVTANQPQADIALEQLVTRFWGHDAIAQALWEIAVEFGKAKNNARAIELHRYNVEIFAGDMYAMKSQTEIICSHIRDDDVAAASAAVNDLLSIFSQQPTLPKEIYQVAREYEKYQEYDEAFDLYKYDFENFPDDIHAMMSQTGIVKCHIRRGDDAAADAAFDDLLTIFADEPTLQEQIHYVARKYEELERYDKALEIYQYNVECYPKDEYTIRSQVRILRSHISNGNDQAADEAFAKLVTLFSDEPTLPKEVYKIANMFNEAGNGQKARQIYQYVIDTWTGNRFAIASRAGIVLMDVPVGDYGASKAAIENLIADYNGNPALPEALLLAGEQCWELALSERRKADPRQVPHEKVDDCFTRALGVWEGIITELSPSLDTARAYHFAAECYRHLGQHQTTIEYYQIIADNWPEYPYAVAIPSVIGSIRQLLKNHPPPPSQPPNALRLSLSADADLKEGGQK